MKISYKKSIETPNFLALNTSTEDRLELITHILLRELAANLDKGKEVHLGWAEADLELSPIDIINPQAP